MSIIDPKVNPQIKLKPVNLSSALRIFQLVDKSRPYFYKWLPWVVNTKDVHDTRSFIKTQLAKSEKASGYLMEIWHQEELVGLIDIHNINIANKRAEIGYWLGEDYQGLGIMTQAVKGMLYFAFIEKMFNRISIKTSTQNLRSSNIPEALGFTLEGIEKEGEFLNGSYHDSKVYAMIKEEWQNSSLSQVNIKS